MGFLHDTEFFSVFENRLQPGQSFLETLLMVGGQQPLSIDINKLGSVGL